MMWNGSWASCLPETMLRVHPIRTWMSNAYLVENETGLYLVDACAPGSHNQILQKIDELGKELKLIVITHAHFDHYGSAGAIRRVTQARIAIHSADAPAMARGQPPIRSAHGRGRFTLPFLPLMNSVSRPLKTDADVILEGDSRLDGFGLPARVLHTPGHTAGSICLLVDDPQGGLLAFTGDLVTAGREPALQRLYADDWVEMARSLARLQAAQPGQVYCGHGSRPIPGEVFQQIKAE